MQRLDIGFQCDDAQIYIVKSMEAIKKLKIKKKIILLKENYFYQITENALCTCSCNTFQSKLHVTI